ncbi:unnamed protein product, partial [Choristocarpus tenellus]
GKSCLRGREGGSWSGIHHPRPHYRRRVHFSINGARDRWLVMETPFPEERVVACLLLHKGDSPGKGRVEVLAVEPSLQQSGVGSHILRKAEG